LYWNSLQLQPFNPSSNTSLENHRIILLVAIKVMLLNNCNIFAIVKLVATYLSELSSFTRLHPLQRPTNERGQRIAIADSGTFTQAVV
jgi:hypothetical protein